VRFAPGVEALFDVHEDPSEVTNYAADPAKADVLAEMRDRMLSRALAAGSSRLPRTHPW
jgi:hypothetical protein